MGNVIEIKDASVERGKKVILDHISWEINDGERWVILGPNGAGKTTLIELATGAIRPSTGTVKIVGEDVASTNNQELAGLVGVSSAAVDGKISRRERVLDVVRTAAYGRSASWTEQYDQEDTERALGLLTTLGVAELAERPYGQISSGERKRISIARALMTDPEILILDEPAAGLDLGGREHVLQSLHELANAQFAPVMILVTHHVEEIPAGFTHALLIDQGKIRAAGPVAEVITDSALSELFGVDVKVRYDNGRFSVVA